MAKRRSQGAKLSSTAAAQIREMWDDYQSRVRSQHPGAAEPFTKFGPRVLRFAKTMANTICASYPTSPANTFPVRLGSVNYTNTSCGNKTLTFTAYTPIEDRVAHSYKNKYIEADEIVLIYLAHDKWYVEEVDSVVMVKATACLYPGSTAAGLLLTYTGGEWTETATVITLSDPGCWNCLLPGERAFALQNSDGVYDIIGSHGLTRKGIVSADITCGQTGSVLLYSDRTDNSCAATASTCTVTACNTWGEVRKIFANEEVIVQYMGTFPIDNQFARRWTIIPTYYPHWVVARLSGDLCPENASAGIQDVSGTYADGCPSVSVTTARNDFRLSGYDGDMVLLLRRDDLQGTQWTLVQVKHQAGWFIYQFDTRIDGCTIVSEWEYERIAYMGCGQFDDDSAQVGFDQEDVVTGWTVSHSAGQSGPGSQGPTAGSCTIAVTTKPVCVLKPQGATTTVTLRQLEPMLALQDVYVDGLCVQATAIIGYVLCLDSADEVELFCGTDCSSGSTASSGQSGGQ